MTRFSKILVVLCTTLSILFMAFSIALRNAGPNWVTESQNLNDYAFAFQDGENPTWSVKYKTADQQLASSKLLPEVLSRAYDDAATRNRDELGQIEPQLAPLQSRIDSATAAIAMDTKGIDARSEQLAAAFKALEQQIVAEQLNGDRFAQQALEIRRDAETYRESGFRLHEELTSIETEHFRLVEQKRRLHDLLVQLKGLQLRLQQREEQLVDEGATAPASNPNDVAVGE